MDQLQCCREFIDDMLKKHSYKKEDLIIALGDFNVDGRNPLAFHAETMQAAYPPLRVLIFYELSL